MEKGLPPPSPISSERERHLSWRQDPWPHVHSWTMTAERGWPRMRRGHHPTQGLCWQPRGWLRTAVTKWVPRGEQVLTNTDFKGPCFLQPQHGVEWSGVCSRRAARGGNQSLSRAFLGVGAGAVTAVWICHKKGWGRWGRREGAGKIWGGSLTARSRPR